MSKVKTTVIQQGKWYRLVQRTNRYTGKTHYLLFTSAATASQCDDSLIGKRTSTNLPSWRFETLSQAESALTMLTLIRVPPAEGSIYWDEIQLTGYQSAWLEWLEMYNNKKSYAITPTMARKRNNEKVKHNNLEFAVLALDSKYLMPK